MVTKEELPEAWRPPEPPTVEMIALPACDISDPAQLAAFYGPFGWADHLRKVVLSNVSELIRAQHANDAKKPTEDRIDDLAHNHPVYVEWLVANLAGRVAYEREVLKRGLGG